MVKSLFRFDSAVLRTLVSNAFFISWCALWISIPTWAQTPSVLEQEALGIETPPPPPPAPQAPAASSLDSSAANDLLPAPTPVSPTPEATSQPEQATTATPAVTPTSDETSINQAERYEQSLKRRREELTKPWWALGLLVEPRAFRMTEWRYGTRQDQALNPKSFGLGFQGERFLFRRFGMTSVGAELGWYRLFGGGEPFRRTLAAVLTGGAYLSYQFHYFSGQWVVPYVQAGMHMARYSYNFFDNVVSGRKVLPRADLGVLIYLNFLDVESAGDMYGNYGITRTYLSVSWSMTSDRKPNDKLNLEGQSIRAGLRFEF